MEEENAVHPLGTKAKVLLSSVFGPYAQDNEYGGRKINPMELFHNQVTRVQGPFSIRSFHSSFGIMMIQDNINAPCTLLDFPTLDRFIDEIKNNSYDIVGIASILANIGKVKKMCKEIRKHLPNATIVIGGHLANKPNIHDLVDVDHVVKGEGVKWFRKFLGENENAPVKHPITHSSFSLRIFGITQTKDSVAALIPSLGCPVGCNFCSTSAKFGGKGKFINFHEKGDSLFKVMCDIEKTLNVDMFFIFDENFLLHRPRALRILELMKEHNKSWSLYVFSSARVMQSYTMEQLMGLGIVWVWMGLEGKGSQYTKLNGISTKDLIKKLQSNGISVLGSSIIGLENHTPDNIDEALDWAVSHDTVYHQFMLYTPLPGTALFEEHTKDESILSEDERSPADWHGQYKFNYKHKHIKNGEEAEIILRAFKKDFEVNGPSIARLAKILLMGWKTHKNNPDSRIRRRFESNAKKLRYPYAGFMWGIRKWYKSNKYMYDKMDSILQDIYKEFGWKTRLIAPLIGRVIYFTTKMEEKRLAKGWTYEPATSYKKNAEALKLEKFGTGVSNEVSKFNSNPNEIGVDKVLEKSTST